MLKTITLICLTFSINCLAKGYARNHKYLFKHAIFTVGNWHEFVGDVQVNDDGDERSLLDFEFNPYFAASMDYFLTPELTIIPEIGYVYRRDAGDSHIDKDLFFLRTDLAYEVYDNLRLRAGSSLMIQTMASDGESVTVNNGTSTEEYYRPQQRSTSINLTLDLGIEYIYKKYSGRFQTYVYDFADDLERKYTYSFSFNYMIELEELL